MNYINRRIDSELEYWANSKNRKPLLLQGTRKVGKSSSIRKLGEKFDYFLEINFEKREFHHIKVLFENNLSPKQICDELSVIYKVPIIHNRTLLFFDEIQSCLPAISSLQCFYEEYPELHVVASGSLFEFTLGKLPSFGVGHIHSLFMYPFSFYEFLAACENNLLLNAIENATPDKPLCDAVHDKALEYLRIFLIIGGMPEVVAAYIVEKNVYKCQFVLNDLIISLRSDFAKYKQSGISPLQITSVFDSMAKQSGKKFIFSKAGLDILHYKIKQALEMLKMAGLAIPVVHTSATDLPLDAEINLKKQKMLMLDTGILQRLQVMKLGNILLSDDFDLINRGGIAEVYAGLEMLKNSSFYEPQQLYYWQREQKNNQAEVDYIIQQDEKIVPVEINSGKNAKMQSMRSFFAEKKSEYGIRASFENFTKSDNIQVYPLYAIGNLLKQK